MYILIKCWYLISSMISSGEKNYKYFIGYKDDYKIKLLSIILTKSSVKSIC